MKKAYTLLLFLIIALPSMAQQIFIEKSGNTETIEFSKLDKITFNNTTVNISQTDGTTTSADMEDFERISFSNYNSIENLKAQNGEFVNYVSKDYIVINCNAGEIVTIYNIIGSELMCTRQKSDNGIISIAHLPRGIYIKKVNDQTAKFVKR